MRADACDPIAKLLACGCDRATGHDSAARAPGTGRIWRHRRIAMHNTDAFDRNAEHFVADLGQRRLKPLAVRLNADTQFEAAIGREPRHRLLEAWHHRNAPAVIDRSAMRP